MTKDPSFPFYASDWLGSTKRALMTPEQRSAYLDLLCHQWGDDDCSLPDDDDQLAALSGLGEGWLKGGCELVRRCFPPHPTQAGRIANPKLLKVRAEREEWVEKSRAAGKKSAEARRRKAKQKAKLEPTSNQRPTKGATNVQPKGNSPSPFPSPSPLPSSSSLPFQEPPPPLPSSKNEHRNLPATNWEEVEEDFLKTGMTDVKAALSVAQQAGWTPEIAAAHLAHYEAMRPAWEPGALHWRLTHLPPSTGPKDGWPPPSDEYKRRRRERHQAREQARRDAEARETKAENERARIEGERLEREHGATIDAMSDAARDELITDADKGIRFIYKKHRDGAMVREAMLEILDKRKKP